MEKFYCPEKINAIKSQLSLTKCEKIPKIDRRGREKRRGKWQMQIFVQKAEINLRTKTREVSENSASIGLKKT